MADHWGLGGLFVSEVAYEEHAENSLVLDISTGETSTPRFWAHTSRYKRLVWQGGQAEGLLKSILRGGFRGSAQDR